MGTLYYLRILRKSDRYVTVTGKGYRPRPIDLAKLEVFGNRVSFWFFASRCHPPMLALIWASLLPFYQVPSLKAFQIISLAAIFPRGSIPAY